MLERLAAERQRLQRLHQLWVPWKGHCATNTPHRRSGSRQFFASFWFLVFGKFTPWDIQSVLTISECFDIFQLSLVIEATGMKRARAEAAQPSAAVPERSGKKSKQLDAKDKEGMHQGEAMATFKGYSLEGIPHEAYPQGDRPNRGAHGYTVRAKNGAVPSKHVMSNIPSALTFWPGSQTNPQ